MRRNGDHCGAGGVSQRLSATFVLFNPTDKQQKIIDKATLESRRRRWRTGKNMLNIDATAEMYRKLIFYFSDSCKGNFHIDASNDRHVQQGSHSKEKPSSVCNPKGMKVCPGGAASPGWVQT